MLDKYLDDELLIICPNDTKKSLLNELSLVDRLYNIKFMDINEFLVNYFYDYDEEACIFLMEKYNVILNVSEVYLENMYPIDVDCKYKSKKLEDLRLKKIELIDKGLLHFNNAFKDYLATKKILVINYPKLEKYIVNALESVNSIFINKNRVDRSYSVYSYNDIEEELNAMFQKIISLVRCGVSLENIHIINLQDEYNYLLLKLSNLYNIPVNVNSNDSIFTSVIVKEYLKSFELVDEDCNNKEVRKKLVDVINSLYKVRDSKYYNEILCSKLKKTSYKNSSLMHAVNVSDLYARNFTSSDYVFVLSFNEGILPVLYKDEDFVSDRDKSEVLLYTTKEKNKREKDVLITYLSNIDNLYLSFKSNGFSSEYYPSSFINDCGMDIVREYDEEFVNSNKYNTRRLAVFLDKFNKYKEENSNMRILLKTYGDSCYNTYDNSFTGINKNKYLDNIRKPLSLSYTSMTSYNKCAFKYYINYVLKLDPFSDNFSAFIGNLYHYLLSICLSDGFDFDKEWDNYLCKRELSFKEKFLLNRLKKGLVQVIEIIKEQRLYTDFKDNLCEKKLGVKLDCKEIEAEFIGTIDKIMMYNEVSTTYYALVDYKTGGYDNNFYNMKYGLSMQLPVYLYLVEKSRLFHESSFAGFYFQKVLIGNVSYNNKKNYMDILNDKLRLDGYSTSSEDVLSHLDHEYTDSSIIKGMKMTANGFSRYAKLLSYEDVLNIIDYTDMKINETIDNIIDARFDINPKIIGDDDVGCSNCKFRDLCYKKEEDYVRLEKLTNFNYIGGDCNGLD